MLAIIHSDHCIPFMMLYYFEDFDLCSLGFSHKNEMCCLNMIIYFDKAMIAYDGHHKCMGHFYK